MGGTETSGPVLFVAGEPDLGIRPLKDVQSPLTRMFIGSGLPGWRREQDQVDASNRLIALRAAADGSGDFIVPADQAECVREVGRIAEEERTTVTVVDVNRPGNGQALVDKWVDSNDVFPLLVRSDGAKLVGADQFVTGKIRRFLRGR
jgi:hypothetical protein